MNTPSTLNRTVLSVARYALLVGLACYFAFPLAFMLVNSFRTGPAPRGLESLDSGNDPRGAITTICQFGIDNYTFVLASPQFSRYFMNSLFIVGTTVSVGLLVNSTLAYSLARRPWRASRLILVVVIALMIVPFNAISMPLLLLVNWFGWLDSYQVQIVPFLATPLYVFLFYQFFIGLPKDFVDQAIVDGANPLQIYWSVILPLSRPVFATVAILNFLVSWSAYLWPLITVQSPEYYPLMIGVSYVSRIGGGAPSGTAMAFLSLTSFPVLILFWLFRKWFMQSAGYSGLL